MRIHSNPRTGALALAATAIVAIGMLTACSSSQPSATPAQGVPTTAPIAATTAAAMPASANFIADMPANSGSAMTTMAIAVDGTNVVAYATNGTNDEAIFSGTQKDGTMNLTSAYADQLSASFDGTTVTGELAMNEAGAGPQKFTAYRVAAPAGMYTATHGDSRATWVVHPDRSTVGVMNNSAPGDHKVTDAIATQNQQFQVQVRQMREALQMRQAPMMAYGTWTMTMAGTTVTAVPVTGSTKF